MAETIPAPRPTLYKVFRSPVLWVFVVTLVVLAIHPLPECFDCQFPRPWGRDDVAYHHSVILLDVWFVLASITAGFCSVRKYWLVPSLIVLADVITQPLGGVQLWSLWNNEGPVILLVGCVVGAICLLAGAIGRYVVDRFVKVTL
jgi:hypothetical protein